MAYNPLITEKQTFWTSAGAVASGYKLFIYLAGTTTKATTYQETTGTANTNPVDLNSRGEVPYGVYVAAGSTYKLVLAPSTDSDPPVAPVWTRDNLTSYNDTTVTVDQWQASGFTPTYVSATSFTVTGDRTSTFQVGRRVKSTNTGGTIYSTITASAYTSLTTVTVVNDSGTLDSGISAVSVSLLTPTNPSTPLLTDAYPIVSGSSDKTKKLRIEVDTNVTTATTRILTVPSADGTIALASNANGTIDVVIRSYLAGLTMSTAGSSATMTIAAGQAADSTNVYMMNLAASISKTTSAWSVGTAAGGIDTGAIANSTWYHFYLIRRTDTGVVDVVFSTSASSPTLPSGYTQYRRIGSGKTNGSAQWTSFIQDGDRFEWVAPPTDSTTTPGAATLRTVSTPLGLKVVGMFVATAGNGGTAAATALHWDPDLGSSAPSAFSGMVSILEGAAGTISVGMQLQVRTNTSSQIYNSNNSSSISTYNLVTEGWIDSRGRDS